MLPKLNHKMETTTLPDSGKVVKYRPFLKGEQKILLMAKESEDVAEIEAATHEIISRCTEGTVDASSLSNIDIEFLFLQLRILSKGAKATIGVKCKHHVDIPERHHPIHGTIPAKSGPCDTVNEISIDLSQVTASIPTNADKVIKITDDVGMEMRYPGRETLAKYGKASTEADIMKLIYECIDIIYCGDQMFPVDEIDASDRERELDEFFDQFNDAQMKKVADFFNTIPTLKMDVKFCCKSCGAEQTIKLRGLSDFF